MDGIAERLRSHGIQPSPQRQAVAQALLESERHLGADEILARAREHLPTLSRATVYNSLHLFADRGLVRELALAEGRLLYDPHAERHHHFVDESTGEVRDVPWEQVTVRLGKELAGHHVREIQVVIRGRLAGARKRDRNPLEHSVKNSSTRKSR
jgi:Fe2+ or Zn2+ uptake regulation protein